MRLARTKMPAPAVVRSQSSETLTGCCLHSLQRYASCTPKTQSTTLSKSIHLLCAYRTVGYHRSSGAPWLQQMRRVIISRYIPPPLLSLVALPCLTRPVPS